MLSCGSGRRALLLFSYMTNALRIRGSVDQTCAMVRQCNAVNTEQLRAGGGWVPLRSCSNEKALRMRWQ